MIKISRIFPDYPTFEELLREGELWLDRYEAHPSLAEALHRGSLFYVISRRRRTLGILWFHDFREPDELSVSFVAHHQIRDPDIPVRTGGREGLLSRSKEELLQFISRMAFDLLQVQRVRAECLVGRQSGKIVAAMGFHLEGLFQQAVQFHGTPYPIACYALYREEKEVDERLRIPARRQEDPRPPVDGSPDRDYEGGDPYPRIRVERMGGEPGELGTRRVDEDWGEGGGEVQAGDDRIDPTAERPASQDW